MGGSYVEVDIEIFEFCKCLWVIVSVMLYVCCREMVMVLVFLYKQPGRSQSYVSDSAATASTALQLIIH